MTRRQIPRHDFVNDVLDQIPIDFYDDGCSNAPDSWFGFDLRYACRIHDWRYCSRCHDPRKMQQRDRTLADMELKQNIRAALPWRWRWIGWFFRFAVWRYGGVSSWDSCGTAAGKRCRHNMLSPDDWDA